MSLNWLPFKKVFSFGWVPDKFGANYAVGVLILIFLGVLGALAFIASILLSVLILVAWVVGACALQLAGIGHGYISPLIEVTAEPVPEGSWMVRTFAARGSYLTKRGPFGRRPIVAFDVNEDSTNVLAHSAPYEIDECIKALVDWIKSTSPNTAGGQVQIQ